MRATNEASEEKIISVFQRLKKDFSEDWLLSLELYEVALQYDFLIQEEIHTYLLILQRNEKNSKLIENGLNLLNMQPLKI
jgi:phenylalanine-4-hydroxylase